MDAVFVGCLILVALACVAAAGIVHATRTERRRRYPEPPGWVNEGDPPRVTPDRRHRPRHDWREDCKR